MLEVFLYKFYTILYNNKIILIRCFTECMEMTSLSGTKCLFSSIIERWSRKPEVVSSIYISQEA